MNNKEINVLDNFNNALSLLEQNDEYYEELIELQSITDKKIDYWLHYIELNKLKTSEAYRIIKELKILRQERRQYKNDFNLIKVFKDNESKMCHQNNRKILKACINKTDTKHRTAQYKSEVYTEEEIKEILGIKEEEEIE